MLIKHGNTSNLESFTIKHSTTGMGLTGLAFDTAGLIISTRCDNEAAATTYTQAGGTIETIATLGTYAAPTATKCRFKEVDATNHPGLYEIQFADARYAVASARKIIISVSGAANVLDIDYEIQLVSFDPHDSIRMGLTSLPNAAADAAGGLPISDAGGLDLDTKLANTNEVTAARMAVLTDWINGGRLDLILDIIAADTTTDIPTLIAALNDITVADIIAGVADGSYDLQEMIRIIFAACAGKSDGGGTATVHFRDSGDTKNRITTTVSAVGNRTAVTLDAT